MAPGELAAEDASDYHYSWLLTPPDLNINKIYKERFDERALRAWQSQDRAVNVQIKNAVQTILNRSRGNVLETTYHRNSEFASIRHPSISLGKIAAGLRAVALHNIYHQANMENAYVKLLGGLNHALAASGLWLLSAGQTCSCCC